MSEANCQHCGEIYWDEHICQDCKDKILAIKRYKEERLVSHLKNEKEGLYGSCGGYCKNGHHNIIPASFKIEAGNKLHCLKCCELICEVIEIEVTEREIT